MLAVAVIAQYHPENGFLCFYATLSQACMLLWYSKTIRLIDKSYAMHQR
jgi:hypothetical protein